jgi:RimJ/RimL family protein N-acetyltransferase
VLREAEARDRTAIIELNASAEVFAYLGGPRDRDELERIVPEVPARYAGSFVVEHDGAAIGILTFRRRDRGRPGHIRPEGDEVEIGYLLLPEAWGSGYATEACAVALAWADRVLPGEPVVLCTQTANQPSIRGAARLGFVEVERFEEFDAEQWFGVRWPVGTGR